MSAARITLPDAERGDATRIPIDLLPERAAFLPTRGTLLIADTHFGKSRVMRRQGIPVPPGTLAEQLARLASAVRRTAARRVIILGDLLHAPHGVTAGLVREVRAAIDALAARAAVELVPGNHDRKLGDELEAACDRLGIRLLPERVELDAGDADDTRTTMQLGHEPPPTEKAGGYVVCGHVHPATVLRGAGDRLKLPAAIVGPSRMILPAFSSFVAGVVFRPHATDTVYAFAPDRVVRTTTRRSIEQAVEELDSPP